MPTANRSMNEDVGFQVKGIQGLSGAATRFLRQHPKEARLAVAAALEAAAVQYVVEDVGVPESVPESLQPFIVRRSSKAEMLGVSEAAERLKISRTTVYDWVDKNILLAWKSTKRGLTIPAEQILGPGNVVPGQDKVVEIIGDAELAWAFLTQDWPFADKVARPIDQLKAGHVEDVINAAPGFGASVT
ncbi:MAG: helix-turn-helix domain-containing protein [Alphaproteobacteria bacterium]|nr:helix-turn-helix domain-containing protein [Alphaproteobacteria bacterium]